MCQGRGWGCEVSGGQPRPAVGQQALPVACSQCHFGGLLAPAIFWLVQLPFFLFKVLNELLYLPGCPICRSEPNSQELGW